MNKNNKKKPLTSLIEINKKILPFFSNPIILKRINDQKKNKDLNSLNPQKKLIYKIIKLNENLVKFTTSIKQYNFNLDLFFLSNISSPNLKQNNSTTHNESNLSYPLVHNHNHLIKSEDEASITILHSEGLEKKKIEDRGFNLQKRLDMNVGNKSEFIIFTRNNLYYNLKYRLSNIMYKIEKFLPVLKFYSLLNNINLFAPKRLLKPQPYTRFTYRIILLNNSFNFKNSSSSLVRREGALLKITSLTESLKTEEPRKKGKSLKRSLNDTLTIPSNLPSLTSTSLSLGKVKVGAVRSSVALEREQLSIKNNNYSDQYGNSIIRLHHSENGRSIKYILFKLDNLLKEIDNIINIKNKLIKIIKIKNIKNLSSLDRDDYVNSNTLSMTMTMTTQPNLSVRQAKFKEKEKLYQKGALTEQHHFQQTLVRSGEAQHKENLLNQALSSGSAANGGVRPSNQSVQNLRLKINRINSNNDNIETFPLLVEAGMVKENKIIIEKNIKSINCKPTIKTKPIVVAGSLAGKFDMEKDIINENSNPVDLLYFNNNLKKPVINQYLKSMSTYNMITNGTILYYSNIIGFNFKNRIKTYLPFIKSISPISKSSNYSLRASTEAKDWKNTSTLPNQKPHSSLLKGSPAYINNGERLTSPYSFRSLRKVVGSLDKGKFSIFGRGIENNKLINNIYKFLYLSFKSMYCLISKPVFIVKSNKIIIQLFYFLLIPKIFKHIKSKTKYKPIKKKGKKLYLSFVEKRKKQALAALFESRLKEKEDAIKKNYFMKHSLNNELNNSNNNSIMILDDKSAPLLNLTYKNEFEEVRKAEEIISGVNFDKSGKVLLDSIGYQLKKTTNLRKHNYNPAKSSSLSLNVNGVKTGLGLGLELGAAKLKNNKIKIKSIKKNKIKKRSYKMFFKRFEFNNINNDLHLLRIPKKWALFSLPKSDDLQKKNSDTGQYRSEWMRSRKFKNPILRKNTKLFKYLALTYLNIFKFKDRRNILNRIKLKINSGFAKKELIKDKSYLLSYNSKNSVEVPSHQLMNISTSQRYNGGIKGNNRRNKFNSYNQINWYLFKKLFWSIRLSKKIIPNAKILQKLGIPQWSWPYSGIKKKGYPFSHMPLYSNKKEIPANSLKFYPAKSSSLSLNVNGDSAQTNLSYSWPFSLLMSTTILQINKKVNSSTDNLNSRITDMIPTFDKENAVKGKSSTYTQQGLFLGEGASSVNYPYGESSAEIIPVIQKQNRYKIRELYTKRYHLMKLANINLVKVYPLKFEKLCEVLNSIFNKPVELDLIRLHYPYNDSNILVRLLAFMINKMKLRRITRRLFNKAVVKSIKKINNKDQVNIIPAFLSGMTIKVAGRLMKYKVVPRKTVKIVRRGSSSIGRINYSDISRYTNKNKRGSFTITIKSGQNFFN